MDDKSRLWPSETTFGCLSRDSALCELRYDSSGESSWLLRSCQRKALVARRWYHYAGG